MTEKVNATSRGCSPADCLSLKTIMALRILNNSSRQLPKSYVNLFHVAQYNLTLWLMEENASRNKKNQKRIPKFQSDHSAT